MSYMKYFEDYQVRASIAEDGKRVYIVVETRPGRADGKSYYESGFVSPPNFIERLLGITWQDKLETKEGILLIEVIKHVQKSRNVELQQEIEKFLKS